jgi:hypothetical protein
MRRRRVAGRLREGPRRSVDAARPCARVRFGALLARGGVAAPERRCSPRERVFGLRFDEDADVWLRAAVALRAFGAVRGACSVVRFLVRGRGFGRSLRFLPARRLSSSLCAFMSPVQKGRPPARGHS